MARKRKTERQRIEGRLWKLCMRLIRLRDENTCQKCRRLVSGSNAHTSHVIGRNQSKRLKYDPVNLKLLCYRCHQWWHEEPPNSGAWFRSTFPDRWEYLRKRRQINGTVTTVELLEMEDRLKQEIEVLETCTE